MFGDAPDGAAGVPAVMVDTAGMERAHGMDARVEINDLGRLARNLEHTNRRFGR